MEVREKEWKLASLFAVVRISLGVLICRDVVRKFAIE